MIDHLKLCRMKGQSWPTLGPLAVGRRKKLYNNLNAGYRSSSWGALGHPESWPASAAAAQQVKEQLPQTFLNLLRPENVDVRRDGGETQPHEARRVVEPENCLRRRMCRFPESSVIWGRIFWRAVVAVADLDWLLKRDAKEEKEEWAPTDKCNDDDEGSYFGGAKLLPILKEEILRLDQRTYNLKASFTIQQLCCNQWLTEWVAVK